jgi:hypothetical protein
MASQKSAARRRLHSPRLTALQQVKKAQVASCKDVSAECGIYELAHGGPQPSVQRIISSMMPLQRWQRVLGAELCGGE